MSTIDHARVVHEATAVYDCLAAPVPHGIAALQAWLVDRIKRAAIRRLHDSRRGEQLLLRMYLAGEEATEQALHEELMPQPPAWLARQVEQHLADERRHAQAFADALHATGASSMVRLAPDWVSRRKIVRWQRLARRHAPHFSCGLLVPAYATGLCAEQMAERVLRRHCEVIGTAHAMYPLLSGVLEDERRHVRLCSRTLQHVVAPHEQARLARLLAEIRAIEAGFGVTGALAMYAAGWMHSLSGGRQVGSRLPIVHR